MEGGDINKTFECKNVITYEISWKRY